MGVGKPGTAAIAERRARHERLVAMRFAVFCRQLEHVVGLGALLQGEDAFRDRRFGALIETLEQASLQAAAFERSHGNSSSSSATDAPGAGTGDPASTVGCMPSTQGR